MKEKILKHIIFNYNDKVIRKIEQIANILEETINEKYNCTFSDIVFERISELYSKNSLNNFEVWLIVAIDILNIELIKYTATNYPYKLEVVKNILNNTNIHQNEKEYLIGNKLDLLLSNSKSIKEIIINL